MKAKPFTLPLLVVVAALLAACSTTPRPLYVPFGANNNYGFQEQQIGDLSYEITFRMPRFRTFAYGRSTRDRIAEQQLAIAHDMALLRASDLALMRGMPAFREIRRDNDVRVDVENDPFYESRLGRPCFDPRFCTPSPFLSTDRRTTVDASVRIEVRLEPRVESGAYDAADTKRRLLAAYPNALPQGNQTLPGGPIGTFSSPGGT